MKSLWILYFIFGYFHLVSSSQKLYYYGAPLQTSETGFIKLDPSSGAWEPAAKGFATTNQYSYYGIIVNPNGDAFMYGQLQLWNGSFIGNMLRLDMNTITPSIFTSGVLGSQISSMTYFDNFNQVALIGNFLGFQQNPSVVLNNVGACTVDGKSCYPLGDGLPKYWNGGSLRSLNQFIYSLYLNLDGFVHVEVYDTTQPEFGWTLIYMLNSPDFVMPLSMEIFNGSLWIFGSMTDYATGQGASAAVWNHTDWKFFNTSIPWSNEEQQFVTSVSPDGKNLYLECYTDMNATMYQWDNVNNNWITIQSSKDKVAIAATNDGLVVASETAAIVTADGTQTLDNLNCSGEFLTVTVSLDNLLLYTFCMTLDQTQLQVTSYNIANQSIIISSALSGFQGLIAQIDGLCVYGQKMVVAGFFNSVGDIKAQSVAMWDNKYQRWYQMMESWTEFTCSCGTDGSTVAALCAFVGVEYPVLIMDSADSDSGNELIAQGTQTYNMTGLSTYTFIYQISVDEDIVYISAAEGIGVSDMVLVRFSPKTGLETLWEVSGTNLFFTMRSNIFYLAGFFDMHNTTITAVMLDMNTNTTKLMDQISVKYDDQLFPGGTFCAQYWSYTNLTYVGGAFDLIGTMRAVNWGGYNLDGTAEDPVAGGVDNWVYWMQPIDSRMYLTSRPATCYSILQKGCGSLFYYDAETSTYSNEITQGVAALSVGEDSTASTSSSNEDISLILPIVVASVFLLCVLFVIAVVIIRRRTQDGYHEIPELIGSSDSVIPIDFQQDDFVMKTALGRGAYGTVWSCVFPNREGGTYAVKQMLFSKGDTKKIEIVKQEIDILEKFRHPNIVHYCGHRMETTQTSVEFFIFMELYDQPCSLKGVIQKRLKQAQKTGKNEWFSYWEIKKFLIQISEGLHYLHLNGVAHRDLKCANILVRAKDGNVTSLHIADFGISRVINPEGHNVLASTVLGTPSFMAPEILSNQKYDAFKADVWSFGIMMYEMITWSENQIPGKKPQFPQDVVEFMNQDSRFAGVLEIFDKCTQQEPNSRPTASDLLFLCESES